MYDTAPSIEAVITALQHDLSEAQQKSAALRRELYGWQEHANRLEDEIDFLWNRNE